MLAKHTSPPYFPQIHAITFRASRRHQSLPGSTGDKAARQQRTAPIRELNVFRIPLEKSRNSHDVVIVPSENRNASPALPVPDSNRLII